MFEEHPDFRKKKRFFITIIIIYSYFSAKPAGVTIRMIDIVIEKADHQEEETKIIMIIQKKDHPAGKKMTTARK